MWNITACHYCYWGEFFQSSASCDFEFLCFIPLSLSSKTFCSVFDLSWILNLHWLWHPEWAVEFWSFTVHEKLARCKWAMSGRKLQGSRRLFTLSGLEPFSPAVLQTAFILRHKHTVVTQDHKGPEVEENCAEWEGKWSYLSQCSCGVSENFNGICSQNYKKTSRGCLCPDFI